MHEDTSWLVDQFGLPLVSTFYQKVVYDHNTLQYRVLTSLESIIEDVIEGRQNLTINCGC